MAWLRILAIAAALAAGLAPMAIASDGDAGSRLLRAAGSGDLVEVRRLLAAGAPIEAHDGQGRTPLLLAGARGRTEIIRMMLPKNPDLAVRNRFGGNALIPACERAHVEAVPLLLSAGIDVNHVNNLGWTCLLEIVILGDGGQRHQEVARLVLAAGTDPNLADRERGHAARACAEPRAERGRRHHRERGRPHAAVKPEHAFA